MVTPYTIATEILVEGVQVLGTINNQINVNRTQRVQIDNVLSDFANIICGVPQGSVLGP